jgi:hypothetical protein
MYSENAKALDQAGATLIANSASQEGTDVNGFYVVECRDAEGNLKWTDNFKNTVVTQGKNNMLDTYFTGISYTAAWYMGLVDGASSPTYSAADTLLTHTGWTESTAYTGNRAAVSWNAATGGSKVTTPTAVSINATATIAGALMCTVASGSSGVLYSVGNFTGGSRAVASGDTLNVTYTTTLT